MNGPEWLGYAASLASGGAFLPQSFKALRTRKTRDLSGVSVTLAFAGTVLWAGYGWLISSGPVILSNIVVMPFALATLMIKWRAVSGDRSDAPTKRRW